MKLKQSLITALILCVIGLMFWELHWRTQTDYYTAYLEDDRNLWTEERAKVETTTSNDIILIGSSRTGYNFNTHVWEETQGIKPINLSTNGKNPNLFFEDVVNTTSFNGTLIIGVTPLGFFDIKFRQKSAKQWVEHYHNRTYAQKLGFTLSKPLKRHLVMLSASEAKAYNNLDLKSLINTVSINDGRVETNGFKLVNIGYNDEDRNLIMFSRMTNNPTYQKEITDEWDKVIPLVPDYSEEIEKMVSNTIEPLYKLVKKFKARGGKIIFIRHKAEDGWNIHAKRSLPRTKVWDKFIKMVDCPAYHFVDYEFMSKYYLPDWSHMNAEDAKTHTRDMVNQLIDDGHLKKYN